MENGFNSDHLEMLDQLFSPNLLAHAPGMPSLDREGLKGALAWRDARFVSGAA